MPKTKTDKPKKTTLKDLTSVYGVLENPFADLPATAGDLWGTLSAEDQATVDALDPKRRKKVTSEFQKLFNKGQKAEIQRLKQAGSVPPLLSGMGFDDPRIGEILGEGLGQIGENRTLAQSAIQGLMNVPAAGAFTQSEDFTTLRDSLFNIQADQILRDAEQVLGYIPNFSDPAMLQGLVDAGVMTSAEAAQVGDPNAPLATKLGSLQQEFAQRGGIRANQGSYWSAYGNALGEFQRQRALAGERANVDAYQMGLQQQGQRIGALGQAGAQAAALPTTWQPGMQLMGARQSLYDVMQDNAYQQKALAQQQSQFGQTFGLQQQQFDWLKQYQQQQLDLQARAMAMMGEGGGPTTNPGFSVPSPYGSTPMPSAPGIGSQIGTAIANTLPALGVVGLNYWLNSGSGTGTGTSVPTWTPSYTNDFGYGNTVPAWNDPSQYTLG